MADPDFYKGSGETIPKAQIRLGEIEKDRKTAYARCEELVVIKETSRK